LLGVHRLSETSAGVRVCRWQHQNYSLPGCCLPPALPRYYRTQTRAHSPSCSASVVAHRIALARWWHRTEPHGCLAWRGIASRDVAWRMRSSRPWQVRASLRPAALRSITMQGTAPAGSTARPPARPSACSASFVLSLGPGGCVAARSVISASYTYPVRDRSMLLFCLLSVGRSADGRGRGASEGLQLPRFDALHVRAVAACSTLERLGRAT
jgi:hypothetical protein